MKNENVYFIYNTQDEIIYIGKSKNLKQRFKAHGCGYKIFNEEKQYYYLFKNKEQVSKITYIEVPVENIYRIEADYISYYKPKYNIAQKRKEASDISKYNFPVYEYDIEKNHNLKLSEIKDITNITFSKAYSIIELFSYYRNLSYEEKAKFNNKYNFNLIDSVCLLAVDTQAWLYEVNNAIAALIFLEKNKLIELQMFEYGELYINFILKKEGK